MSSQPRGQSMALPHIKNFGFTTLSAGGEVPEGDIVIVHGLQGHPWKTWACKNSTGGDSSSGVKAQNPGLPTRVGSFNDSQNKVLSDTSAEQGVLRSSTYWPSDLLARDYPHYRILTYGYDSHVSHFLSGAVHQGNIATIARDLLHELAAERRDCPTRPLLFICHSLGGLVVKMVGLCRSRNSHMLISIRRLAERGQAHSRETKTCSSSTRQHRQSYSLVPLTGEVLTVRRVRWLRS
jgi:hypothetical protein